MVLKASAVGTVVAGVVLAVASCAGSSPSPPPAPTLGTEVADHAAAADAYHLANRLVDRTLQRGEAKLPAQLLEVADPDGTWYRRQAAGVADRAERGVRLSGESELVQAFPAPGSSRTADRLELYVCTDGRHTTATDASGRSLGRGRLAHGVIAFRRTGADAGAGTRGWRVADYVGEPGLQETSRCNER